MNKFRGLAMAGLFGAGMAVAGGNIWDFPNMLKSTNEPYWGQAKVPGAIYCWGDAEEPSADNDYYSPCYEATGGWWFGYGFNEGVVYDKFSNNDLTLNEAIKVEEYDATENGHVVVTGKGLGNSVAGSDDGGFDLKFVLPGGTDEEPTGAGIGFNWRNKDGKDYEGSTTENISNESGLCVVYKSSATGVDMELGWPTSFGDDNWIVKLPAATNWNKVDVSWDDFVVSYESASDERPLSDALNNAEALKFVYKNKTADAVNVDFRLREVGWKGTCSGESSPINNIKLANAPKFSLVGRALSINAAASVQVINMQGAVVAQKALGANETLNLTSIPTGVYLVRAPKLGISQKILVK